MRKMKTMPLRIVQKALHCGMAVNDTAGRREEGGATVESRLDTIEHRAI